MSWLMREAGVFIVSCGYSALRYNYPNAVLARMDDRLLQSINQDEWLGKGTRNVYAAAAS